MIDSLTKESTPVSTQLFEAEGTILKAEGKNAVHGKILDSRCVCAAS
jgi:hypothetical protein